MSREHTLIDNLPVIQPKPLSLAISAVLAIPAGAAMAQDQQDSSEDLLLEEVMVTARKRTESLQNVPESIQAISAQTIEQAGMRGMDDYVRFIPSLNIVQANPGTAMVIFRGIADAQSTFIAEPSAAVYLDEQSLVLNGQPNPRMVDIERVEALSGPQGTLYGASAQSGVLRIITNKPDPTAFDGNFDVSLKSGSESAMSYDASAMVNIPVNDTFAVRLVGFSARDGGFIDNVLGTTPRFGTENRSDGHRPGTLWTNFLTNEDAVKKDINEVNYTGGRVTARWLMSDTWTMTAGIVYQKTEADARNEHDPVYAGDLNVVRFYPEQEFDNQDWTQYALTFEGDLGFADFVSATSYFERDWTYTQDTSVGYAAYFATACYNPITYYWIAYTRYCFQPQSLYESLGYESVYFNDPTGYLTNTTNNWKFSQEFRLIHQGDTIDWVAGVFYEKSHEDWQFTTFTDGYNNSHSFANYLNGNLIDRGNPIPTRSPDDAWWYSADDTDWEQWAVFGEMTWHINDAWDVTAGYRQFDRKVHKEYFVELPQFNPTDEGISVAKTDVSDGVPKLSVSWQVNDNSMLYALYSEGFRPGGTNRNRGLTFHPATYDADKLENFEIGTKNTLADGRVRLNATYFDMTWTDYQLEVVDPSNIGCENDNALPPPLCGQPWQKVVANVGNASSSGFELQVDWVATKNLTVGVNGTWLNAELDDRVDLGGDLIVPKGSRLPLSPEFKGSAYAQYNWDVNWFSSNNAWVRLQWSYTGDMLNQVEPTTLDDGPSPQIKQPAYNIGDIRFGIDHDKWSFQAYVNNVTDERAVLFANPYEFDNYFGRSRVTVNRPREMGIRWIQRFGK